ncbi:TPA: restriction endonuclease subunit S [Vibrio vulnificus]|nr:restriction endonuclease subunit S [Vibrio vulnificus]
MGSNPVVTTKLSDLCELIVDCPHSTPKWTDSGFVVLRNQNIRNGALDLTSPSYTDEAGYNSRIKRAVPQAGDIVITREAPMGEVCIIPEGLQCCLGQRQVLLRPKKGISNEYLFWALQSPFVKHQISWNEGTGTTVSNIRIPVLKAFEIPRWFEQEPQIAAQLSAIDKKITLNRQINQTLEQMAQTLFKSWFVDFDPVMDNALDAGNPIPDELQHRAEARKAVRESEGFKPLPDDVRQLFPDSFEESELGWVPKGWEMKSVSGALTVNPKVKLSKGQSAHFVDMKALPTSGYSIEEVTHKAFSGGAKFEQNDVLLARITPCLQNGKTGFVDFLGADEVGFGSTEFIVLRGDKDVHHTYIACLARHEKFRQHAMQSMVGSSGRQRVQNSCFDDYFIAVPTDDVMKRFAQMTQPSFDKFKANTAESIALAELRDTLLPKLISGELRLDDVEAFVEQEAVSA